MKTSKTIAVVLGAATTVAVWYYLKPHPNMENTKIDIDPKLPRGYRNNNPLNIRYSALNAWKGKILPNTDGAFEQFETMAHGYRAALYILRKYIAQGYNTVSAIINRWAPDNENNTTGYIQSVCNLTGYEPSTKISATSYAMMENLVYAMSIVENGNTPTPSRNDILSGWQML